MGISRGTLWEEASCTLKNHLGNKIKALSHKGPDESLKYSLVIKLPKGSLASFPVQDALKTYMNSNQNRTTKACPRVLGIKEQGQQRS
jgi:hypothetical protein